MCSMATNVQCFNHKNEFKVWHLKSKKHSINHQRTDHRSQGLLGGRFCVYGHGIFINHLFQIEAHGKPTALQPMRKCSLLLLSLTFDGDDMLPDLVLQKRLLDALQQLIDGVDVRMHRLEALDLGADGGRVGQVLLVVHGYQQPEGQASLPGNKVDVAGCGR